MKHEIYNNRGFTLVEALVVIAIISIISGFIVINFRHGEEGNKLQRSAQQVVQSIRKAQNMALSSVEYEGTIYDYYGVYFDEQGLPNSYYIFTSINAVYNPTEGDKIVETVNLEQGIIIEVTPSTQLDIAFIPPHSFIQFNPSVSNTTITIKKDGGTCPQDCKYVKINDKGWLSIKDTP